MGARAPRNPHQNSSKYKGKLRPIFKFGVSFLLMRFYGSANASTSASASARATATAGANASASASASMRSLA